jgi:prepilin-type N-terminal cleavage/methylation domain-containing protein
MKKGFGLLEVLVAAVVLGFLIVGLTRLQLGNRETILRIRERDAANIIAQHVLDSLGAVGINLIADDVLDIKIIDKNNTVHNPRKYVFGGKEDEKSMNFYVNVEYLPSTPGSSGSNAIDVNTDLNEASNFMSSSSNTNTFAKNILATVSWKHKNSEQSIKMFKVLR